ncbi:hypothetical protein FNJ88_12065 [Chryseobacterium sp. SNU WT5]|uniref:hypothetical protein n=1 Tax=Chryseobacterium sp. SNU WT5 TaxID=2594269 RepID=UPI00117DF334|nr:hypothetical protein [Chryseobacterium sp. SNU WT5]QDP86247.1 hypothetical protein FNJ88_12065 [Chryseobacterium sp. SNU WT5]
MTFGQFDESFVSVPIIKNEKIVSVMQGIRNKKTNKVFFSHTEDTESISFFQNIIFSKRILKPLKDTAYPSNNSTSRAYWQPVTSCSTRTLIVGCTQDASGANCTPIVSTTTTCTTTYIFTNDYDDSDDGYYPPDGYTYDGTRPNVSNEEEDPCAKMSKYGKSEKTKSLMRNLKAETSSNKEKGYTLTDESNSLVETYFEGEIGNSFLDIDVSSGVNVIIHSHYTGLLSIFSPDDIFNIAGAYKGGFIRDPNNFVLGVVTDSGTQYYLIIDDLQKFSNFANMVLQYGFDIYNHMYANLSKVNQSNTNIQNEYNFLNYLKLNNSGLSVMKGDADMNSWSKIGKGDNKNEIKEDKCP